MPESSQPITIRIVATPDSTVTPVTGLYETFLHVEQITAPEDRVEGQGSRLEPEIVAEAAGTIESVTGLPITAHRSVDEVSDADVVIVPSMAFGREGEWTPGRYPRLVPWLRDMYEHGATVCSTCTGANVVAEAGLLDGGDATVNPENAG